MRSIMTWAAVAAVLLALAPMGGAAVNVELPSGAGSQDECARMNAAFNSQPPRCAKVTVESVIYYIFFLSSDDCKLGGSGSPAPAGSNPTFGIYRESNGHAGLQSAPTGLIPTPDTFIVGNCTPWFGP